MSYEPLKFQYNASSSNSSLKYTVPRFLLWLCLRLRLHFQKEKKRRMVANVPTGAGFAFRPHSYSSQADREALSTGRVNTALTVCKHGSAVNERCSLSTAPRVWQSRRHFRGRLIPRRLSPR